MQGDDPGVVEHAPTIEPSEVGATTDDVADDEEEGGELFSEIATGVGLITEGAVEGELEQIRAGVDVLKGWGTRSSRNWSKKARWATSSTACWQARVMF